MNPAIRRSPVSRWAFRITLTAPAWEQPDTITQATLPDVHDHVLVVEDQGVRLPAVLDLGEMDGETSLELGHSLDLAGHEHRVVEKQRLAPFFHQFQSLRLEVRAAWRRQPDLGSGRQDDLALAPRLGMNDER